MQTITRLWSNSNVRGAVRGLLVFIAAKIASGAIPTGVPGLGEPLGAVLMALAVAIPAGQVNVPTTAVIATPALAPNPGPPAAP